MALEEGARYDKSKVAYKAAYAKYIDDCEKVGNEKAMEAFKSDAAKYKKNNPPPVEPEPAHRQKVYKMN